MEKIAIGVPYEISIEPSIDIGEFDAELILERDDSRIGVELKKIKGEDIEYSFIVPSELSDLFGKKAMDYSIFVYKENARFEVDDGKLSFIDEKDFKVKGGAGGKMRRAKEETPEPTKAKKKKAVKKTPTTTPAASDAVKEQFSDPADFAQSLIEREAQKALKSDAGDFTDHVVPQPTPLPQTRSPKVSKPTGKPAASPGNLHGILEGVEKKKERDERRKRINDNIRQGIKKP
jgi:hypothetical protein